MLKKGFIFVFILGLVAGTVFAQKKKFQFSIFGGIDPIFEYGAIEDYSLGENDFPVTPTHTPPYIGLSLSYFFVNNFKVELDWRYVFNSNVTLTDPSDGDTLEIDTSKQYFSSLNVVYQCSQRIFRPYFLAGVGINKMIAEKASYITEYGYEIEFGIPDNTTALFTQVGGGLDFLINPSFGLLVDVRFVYLFTESDNIICLFAGAGAYFLF
ncbi:hypothetical protein ACFLRX_03095 [Acidobacteriota bacterium]